MAMQRNPFIFGLECRLPIYAGDKRFQQHNTRSASLVVFSPSFSFTAIKLRIRAHETTIFGFA